MINNGRPIDHLISVISHRRASANRRTPFSICSGESAEGSGVEEKYQAGNRG
jgi:hypothetical protein